MLKKSFLVKTVIVSSSLIMIAGFVLFLNRKAICASIIAHWKSESTAGDLASPTEEGETLIRLQHRLR